jgi:putative transposase
VPDASSLRVLLSLLHEKTAKWANRLDRAPGRKVWFNYRETRLTYQKSYLARLNYTHQNAVKHGLVAAAHLYPWCSALPGLSGRPARPKSGRFTVFGLTG